ncbi:MAG: helix-turn-helix domain-containing protein [Acutalibacteraceae bacterium]
MKQRRKEWGISVEDVAAALGVSVATVYRTKKGTSKGAGRRSRAARARPAPRRPTSWAGRMRPPQAVPLGFQPLRR